MKVEKTFVSGFEASIRAMRNPLDSWSKSDSHYWGFDTVLGPVEESDVECPERPLIGPNDLALAQRLIKNGKEHSKFTRTINVWVDLTLPLYIWAEFDTYKVAVVRNSCSTMHMLGKRALTLDDFEDGEETSLEFEHFLPLIEEINKKSFEYREKKSLGEACKRPVGLLKKPLMSSYLQKSTIATNYAVLRGMYLHRRYHRLPEWNIKQSNTKFSICKWIETLPYSGELITLGK